MIVGERYGRLVAIREMRDRSRMWLFLCDCGNEKVVAHRLVKSGNTVSCGCRSKECLAEGRAAKRVHGMIGTPEYAAWASMKRRCCNPNSSDYGRYGGRGIYVCAAWLAFPNFFADVGYRPSANHSLERIDVNGNYEPGNVEWIEAKYQARNRRSSRLVEFNGERVTLAEACERAGANYKKAHERLKAGWPLERALA